jgi:hypothetical protein
MMAMAEPDDPAAPPAAPDDATAPPEAAPADPAADAPAPDGLVANPPPAIRRRWHRWLAGVLAAVAAVIAIAVYLVATRPGIALGPRLAVPTPPTGPGPLLPVDPPVLPAPVDGPGDQQLGGLVVDGAGLPVGQLAVTALPEAADPAAIAVVAITGPDGHFELRGLVPGRYRIALEGDAIFDAEVRFVPVPADLVRFVVARRVAIAGLVTDGGQPVAGATVAVDSDALLGERTATTDAAGRFEVAGLPEGSYRVWAWAGARVARAVRVPRLGRGPFPDVAVALEAGAAVAGRVVDRQTGGGVAAAVTVRAEADEPPRHVRTEPDGRFQIAAVPPGRWSADAWAPGWLSAGTVDFAAGAGAITIELVPGGIVEGVVVDAAGAPVAGATVAAVEDGPGGREQSAAAAEQALRLALGQGVRRVADPGQPAGADNQFLPRGELGVMLGPIPFAPPPGAAPTAAAAIISDPADPSVGGGPAIAPLAVDPAYQPTWTTGADGRFRLTGLPAGGFLAVAEAPGYVGARSPRLTLALGQVVTGVELVLERGVAVVGQVRDQHGAPVPGALVRFTPDGAPAGRGAVEAATDADGRYRAGPFAGRLTVAARAWGHGDWTGTLDTRRVAPGADPTADRTLDITLVVADAAVEGVVEDPAGLPLVGARIAVDGGAADGRATVAGPGGRFRIAMLPAGPLHLRVEHPDYPPQRFLDDTGDDARLRLAYGGGLELVVFDHHTGSNLAGIPVIATGPDRDRREVTTDPSGRVRLVPIAAGPWRLAVRTPGYVAARLDATVPVGQRGGQITATDLRLELERGAIVAGTVRDRAGDRVARATIAIRRGDLEVTATADAQGEFRAVDVPTGAVTVTATKGPATATATLELRPGDERGGVELMVVAP